MKTTVTTGYHVKVEAEPISWAHKRGTETQAQANIRALKHACDEIVAGIKRHVDDIGWISVMQETEPRCSYCGRDWTEDSSTYNGGCCDEDEANNPENATTEEAAK